MSWERMGRGLLSFGEETEEKKMRFWFRILAQHSEEFRVIRKGGKEGLFFGVWA